MALRERSNRRSEEIRRRRITNKAPAQPRRTAAAKSPRRSATAAEPPPVMARSFGSSAAPGVAVRSRRSANQKARRRYDVALPIQGAEIRLPSLPQISVGWRLVSAALIAVMTLTLYYLWTAPVFQVEEAKISGLKRLSNQDVSAVLDVAGKPVFTVNPGQMRQDLLESFPEFSAVAISVSLPSTVAITVTERVPVLTWHQDGRTELVDAQGYVFPVRNGTKSSAGPVVEANAAPPALLDTMPLTATEGTPGLAEQLLSQAAAGSEAKDGLPQPVNKLPAARPFMSAQMVKAILQLAKGIPQDAALVYDDQHGFQWKDGRGWQVYFGDAQDMDAKLSVYQALVKQLLAQEIQPVLISVEHVHSPYYRLEK